MSNGPLGKPNLAQVALVVRDIEQSAKRFAALFGVPVPEVIVTEPGQEVHQTYRGRPSDAQAKLAFFDLGQVQLELIEPIGGPSTWQEALDRRGESLHHIAFWVDDMQAVVDSLKAHGIPLVQRGDMDGGQYAYMDGEAQLGVTIELLEKVRAARVTG